VGSKEEGNGASGPYVARSRAASASFRTNSKQVGNWLLFSGSKLGYRSTWRQLGAQEDATADQVVRCERDTRS